VTKTEIITLIINAMLLPLITWGISELTAYLKKKVSNEALNKYFDQACDAVVTVVREVMQTFVSTAKKNGTWNKETADEALALAKAKAVQIMGATAYKALTDIVGDVDAWLISKIEAAILEAKQTEALSTCSGSTTVQPK